MGQKAPGRTGTGHPSRCRKHSKPGKWWSSCGRAASPGTLATVLRPLSFLYANSNGGAGCVTGLLNGRRLWLFNGAIVPPRIASSVSVKLDVAAKAAVGTSAFLPARDNDAGFAFTTGAGEARVKLGQHPSQDVPEPPKETFGGGIFTSIH